jgi:hypothetical protein
MEFIINLFRSSTQNKELWKNIQELNKKEKNG